MALTIDGTNGIETNTDTGKIKFGADDDLQIYHSGSHATITNTTGNLNLTNTGSNTIVNSDNITFQSGDQGETIARFLDDGACELWHDNTKRFETYSNGTLSTGNMKCTGNVYVGNQVDGHDGNSTGQLMFGAGNDLKIWHDGTTNIIEGLDSNMSIRPKSGENGILLRNNGSVDLYHNDTHRMSTTTWGIKVHGNRGFETGTFATNGDSVGIKHNMWDNNEVGIGISHLSTGGQSAFAFHNPNGQVGYIQTSGSGTIFGTSSDYRLKENEVAISDGITRLKQLKPYRFNFKKDPSTTVDGFFAHEAQEVVPEAVTGTKDEVATKDEGTRKTGDVIPQAIDQAKLVPLLTAALKEAITKIETLETKVAALEAS